VYISMLMCMDLCVCVSMLECDSSRGNVPLMVGIRSAALSRRNTKEQIPRVRSLSAVEGRWQHTARDLSREEDLTCSLCLLLLFLPLQVKHRIEDCFGLEPT